MNLADVKEELRNKRGELYVATIACAVAFVSTNAVGIAWICMIVASFASLSLGAKDWSSGRKLAGVGSHLMALILLLAAGGSAIGLEECLERPDIEAAMAKCRSIELAASQLIRPATGISFLWYVLNPFLWHGTSKRLRRPGRFVTQHGVEVEAKKPTRWFSKERRFEEFVLKELEQAGIGERQRYEWGCDVREIAPEAHDGGTRYEWKASSLLADAPWHSVYELVERCVPAIGFLHRDHFVRRVNEYLREAEIGWIFENGNWTRVGDEIGRANLAAAHSACSTLRTEDAAKDLENAWKLCNQPGGGYEKDAVAAAMRALERVVQNRTEQGGISLNRIKWEGPNVPHDKLRGTINTLYSYSSDQARHANQGAAVSAKDAHLVVSIAGALIVYLTDRNPAQMENQKTTNKGRQQSTKATEGAGSEGPNP